MQNKEMELQGEKYWKNRSVEDMMKDWGGTTYLGSINHPHRETIVNAVKSISPVAESILEVGCNSGPNLALLQEELRDVKLAGIDLNEESIWIAKTGLPSVDLRTASVLNIPFKDKSFDVVLADAVLMYVHGDDWERALSELDRVAKNAIILCEWGSNKKQEIKHFHWARDYGDWLMQKGFGVFTRKLTKEEWPNPRWEENGYLYIAVRPSQTGKTS